MANNTIRVGIIGCGRVARIHVERLRHVPGAEIAGCADTDGQAAASLAATLGSGVPSYAEPKDLLTRGDLDAVAIFTPHRMHYRLAMDALQAGCHVFIEKPLSTNSQEAHDIVKLARGRGRKVAVGHQYRLRPSLIAARDQLATGAIGKLRMVTAIMARPWLAAHSGPADAWRLDPRVSGGGILADVGDHLLDSLLWTTGRTAVEVAAIQDRIEPGLDIVTAATVRLSDEVPACVAVCGASADSRFELTFHGESGWARATESELELGGPEGTRASVPLPTSTESIDSNFVAAVLHDEPLSCPAEAAVETVRLLEALGRSAASGQVVRL